MVVKKKFLVYLTLILILFVFVIISLIFSVCKVPTRPPTNSEKYNGIYTIAITNYSNDTTVFIIIRDAQDTVINKSNVFVKSKFSQTVSVPLPEGNYSVEVITTDNKSITYTIIIRKTTPNELYFLSINDEGVWNTGYPIE